MVTFRDTQTYYRSYLHVQNLGVTPFFGVHSNIQRWFIELQFQIRIKNRSFNNLRCSVVKVVKYIKITFVRLKHQSLHCSVK